MVIILDKFLLRRFDATLPILSPNHSREAESRAISAIQRIATISGLPLLSHSGSIPDVRIISDGERMSHLTIMDYQFLPTLVDVSEYIPVDNGSSSTAYFAKGWWFNCGRFVFSSLGDVFTGGHSSPLSSIALYTWTQMRKSVEANGYAYLSRELLDLPYDGAYAEQVAYPGQDTSTWYQRFFTP